MNTLHTSSRVRYLGNKQGSVLIMAILFATVLSLIVGSLLKYTVTEMRLNRSQTNFLEANYAAESMAEYGFAQLQKRWVKQTSFESTELQDDPIDIPSTVAAFYAGTNVVYDELELVGGNVSNGEWVYIDPTDPVNSGDPQKGKRIHQYEVEVFAKGVSEDPTLGKREAYCTQTLAVRESPLFSHAIFYGMDLEFHPGPAMEMEGPVYADGDLYLSSVNSLKFYSTLSAYGEILHGMKSTGNHDQNGQVLIKDAEGNWKDVYVSGDRDDDDSYVDQRMGDEAFRVAATERWSGNVQSSAHDVPKLQPVGFDDYVSAAEAADINAANAALSLPEDQERMNPSFAIIEPQVGELDANYKGAEVQSEQMSYKAGLVLKVDKVIDASEPDGYRYELSAYNYNRDSQLDPKSAPKTNVDGTLKTQDLPLDTIEAKKGAPLLTAEKYAEDVDGNITGGFYDRRQLTEMDVIELDMSVLADIINNGETATGATDPWNGKYKLNPGTAIDWNGVVYVEMPYDDTASTRADKVLPAERNVALRIVNAETVPNPSFAKSSGYDEGFTLATNGQLYVKGHFNADGVDGTGSSTGTDDNLTSTSTEAPAAIMADSITILSDAFDDSLSKANREDREAVFTEVSAAMVTGLVPTDNVAGTKSGGAHNLPRFLEDWGGVEFRYRGSLVALYESEAGVNPMSGTSPITGDTVGSHSAWYKPPQRVWGYNNLFSAGIYPPGTPNARDYRRTNYRFMTAAEYNAALAAIDSFDEDNSPRGHTP